MDIFLQLWGGIFYLLAKIFLAISENKNRKNFRIHGWIVYIIGVPAWVIILFLNKNWIVMSIEAGSIPSMIFGIIMLSNKSYIHDLEKYIKTFTGILIVLGIMYSIYDFGGINNFSQILELGITVGFLMGTYLLAKKNHNGWLYFALMNISMGILMIIQSKWIFVILQIISIFFVIYGFMTAKKEINFQNR